MDKRKIKKLNYDQVIELCIVKGSTGSRNYMHDVEIDAIRIVGQTCGVFIPPLFKGWAFLGRVPLWILIVEKPAT